MFTCLLVFYVSLLLDYACMFVRFEFHQGKSSYRAMNTHYLVLFHIIMLAPQIFRSSFNVSTNVLSNMTPTSGTESFRTERELVALFKANNRFNTLSNQLSHEPRSVKTCTAIPDMSDMCAQGIHPH